MKKRLLVALILTLAAPVRLSYASDYGLYLSRDAQRVARDPSGPGLGMTFDAARNNDGAYAVGPGLRFGFGLGALSLGIGGKALFVRAAGGETGMTTPLSATAGIRVAASTTLFGQVSYSPRALFNNHLGSYRQTRAGVRWNGLRPMTFEVGWQHDRLDGRNGSEDSHLANGLYLGVAAKF
jgi:hypothetical protein